MTQEDRCLECQHFDNTYGMCRKKMQIVICDRKACNLYEKSESLVGRIKQEPNFYFRPYFDIYDIEDVISGRRR